MQLKRQNELMVTHETNKKLEVLKCGTLIMDVCINIYVMMSSDLYGTCRHSLCGTLSHAHGCNCNPFGNVATVKSCKTLHWMQKADGSNVF